MKMISASALMWTLAFLVSGVFAQSPKSVNDGVYTAAQADRGMAVFKTTCAACHETSQFSADDFLSGWQGKPLFDLYDTVHTTMPQDNPGSLKPNQYADVVAYFLKLNNYPTGSDELPSADAALKAIKFDKKK